jgi:hypothetical protein
MNIPAVTMADTSGGSHLYHMYIMQNGGGSNWTLGATPAGYTDLYKLSSSTSYAWGLFSKSNTTSDGAIVLSLGTPGWNTGGGWSVASIEVLAGPTSGFFQMF